MRRQQTSTAGLLALQFAILSACGAADSEQVLDSRLHHLRTGSAREWDEFPRTPEAEKYELTFDSEVNKTEWTLRLRQQDVKQSWRVRLNGHELGSLTQDENDMVVYFVVDAGVLTRRANRLTIEQDAGRRESIDDIRVGEIALAPRSLQDLLSESNVEVTVVDTDVAQRIPSRITILNESGSLQSVYAAPDPQLAVRPGTIYTATGQAVFHLPAGTYTIYAGRGFEYSLATTTLTIGAGETNERTLEIRREVPTDGYVACDTHVHSLTHSGHGDASVQERMVTIAGEGIELPIATDHNVQIDHDSFARTAGVRQYFTPVVGNEVTTPVGHFNIFPVPKGAEVPNHKLTNWEEILAEIESVTGAPIVVLNHARDLHSGVRPFGPRHFNDVVAANLDGWSHGFTAMEVVNSGATQTNVLQLFEDWTSLLNRGESVVPVGSSDSHDVARHFVGQGRTYVRCDDGDPGNISVDQVVDSLQHGRVMVSYGLLAKIDVDGRGSGELVALGDQQTVRVDVQVLGPHWVQADRVELFANGRKIREQLIETNLTDGEGASESSTGVKWRGHWMIPRPSHDVHLVAIARGPGIDVPYWKTAKPYQPTSPMWESQVIGCSGAVWLDADGDGERTSAREYAKRLWDASDGDLRHLLQALADYDAAVAAHVADYFHDAGGDVIAPEFRRAVQTAKPLVQEGFQSYVNAWRESQTARASQSE